MKLATIVLMGISLLGSLVPLNAGDPAPGASQVVAAFTGGSVMASDSKGICIVYYPLLGDLNAWSLFSGSMLGVPIVDKEHAYLIWVSDFSMNVLPPNKSFNFLALVPTGEATIYFSDRPDTRIWRDLTERSTWGEPVAKFVRKAGLFQSTDGGMSGALTISAVLVSSKPFKLNGKTFNFRDLMPHGMTCSETGIGEAETGTCVAIGGPQETGRDWARERGTN